MTETTVLKSGDVNSFSKLANFNSREDMDLAIRAWLFDNKHNLTMTEEKFVNLISQLSYKFKGVFFCKHETLAKQLELSIKTVQRCLKKLKDLGLVAIHQTRTGIKQKTVKGKGNPKGRGHNVYVINAIDTTRLVEHVQSSVQSVVSSRSTSENVDTPVVEDVKTVSDTLFSYAKFSKRVIKTLVQQERPAINQISISDLVGHWIPESFKTFAVHVFESPKEIETAYSIIRKTVKNAGYYADKELEDFSNLAIRAYFRKVKEFMKNNKVIENPYGYLKGIVIQIVENQYQNPLYTDNDFEYNKVLETPQVTNEELSNKSVKKVPLYNWLEIRD